MGKQDKICFVSVDVEHDVGTGGSKTFRGVGKMHTVLSIFEKFNVPATLFVTGHVLEKYREMVREWEKSYEIASHSYSHVYFNELSYEQKEGEIKKFIEIYKNSLGDNPKGFRAPSHVIDEETFTVLEKYGFVYDSSVVPRYPKFKRYRGYAGRAPTMPYFPQLGDIRQREAKGGKGRVLELPVTGQVLGVPLAGTWIRKLPLWFYRVLFLFNKPSYITLSMHSWDAMDARFMRKLVKILNLLQNKGYVFKSGGQIAVEKLA